MYVFSYFLSFMVFRVEGMIFGWCTANNRDTFPFSFSSSSAAALLSSSILITGSCPREREGERGGRSPFAVCLVCGPRPPRPLVGAHLGGWEEGAWLSLFWGSFSLIAIFSTRIRLFSPALSPSLSVLSVVVAFHYICCSCCCWLAIDFMLCRCN